MHQALRSIHERRRGLRWRHRSRSSRIGTKRQRRKQDNQQQYHQDIDQSSVAEERCDGGIGIGRRPNRFPEIEQFDSSTLKKPFQFQQELGTWKPLIFIISSTRKFLYQPNFCWSPASTRWGAFQKKADEAFFQPGQPARGWRVRYFLQACGQPASNVAAGAGSEVPGRDPFFVDEGEDWKLPRNVQGGFHNSSTSTVQCTYRGFDEQQRLCVWSLWGNELYLEASAFYVK